MANKTQSFPGILPGDPFANEPTLSGANVNNPIGVFSSAPGMTPKYARNEGVRGDDFRDSMARMFVAVGPGEYEDFVQSVAAADPGSEALARILAGGHEASTNVGGYGYIDFLLQNVQSSFQEKMEVIELLSDNYVSYFFGQAAPVFSYSGTLVNSLQDDQAVNMYRIYKNIIRGSQLAARNKLVRLRYDSYIVAGAATGFTHSLTAEMETAVPFSFQLLVKSITVLPNPDYGLVVLAPSSLNSSFSTNLSTGTVSIEPVDASAVTPLGIAQQYA